MTEALPDRPDGERCAPASPLGTKTRYPLGSLADACGLSEHALCVRLGLSGSTMQKVLADGLSALCADRYAVRMGYHAAVIWPELLNEAVEEARARRRAQWAAAKKRRYHNDPDYRARQLEYGRQYRAAAKKALAAQKQRWVEANRERVRARGRVNQAAYRARKKAAQSTGFPSCAPQTGDGTVAA